MGNTSWSEVGSVLLMSWHKSEWLGFADAVERVFIFALGTRLTAGVGDDGDCFLTRDLAFEEYSLWVIELLETDENPRNIGPVNRSYKQIWNSAS